MTILKNNECNVCKKMVRKKAELCSSCRVIFEYIKNKHPEATYEQWILLTRQLIIDREEKRLERRLRFKIKKKITKIDERDD